MKQKIEAGDCFGSFYEDGGCSEKGCYVSFACSLASGKCGKQAGTTTTIVNEVKTVIRQSLSDLHDLFLNRLTDIFPRMQPTIYPEQGAVHEFSNSDGKIMCRIQTKYPEYIMIIDVYNHDEFEHATLNTNNDIETLVNKIKLMVN